MQQESKARNEAFRVETVLARWRTRIFLRSFGWHVRNTLQGKLGIVVAIYLVVTMAWISVRGFFDEVPAEDTTLRGMMLVAHAWLLWPLGLMLLAQHAKLFLVRPLDEPLAVHPSLNPFLAVHRVVCAIPVTGTVMLALFFAYFWQLFDAAFDNPWVSMPVHLIVTALQTVVLTATVGAFGLVLLRRAMGAGVRRANLVVNFSIGVALTGIAVVLLVVLVGGGQFPGFFDTVGRSKAAIIPAGMIPYAAAVAADEGRWFALAGWLGLSAGAARWALEAVHRWSFSAYRDIPIDLTSPARRMFRPAFTGRPVRRLPVGLSAFWRKDIVVFHSREPKRYLFHQMNVFWWSGLTVFATVALLKRTFITPAFADTVPVSLILLGMAAVARQHGLTALGREGKELTRLRPIFTGRQLFGRKLMVSLAFALIHAIAYAIVGAAAMRSTTVHASFWTLLAYAVCSSIVFACLATALGFLLPDFEWRTSSHLGSTNVGKGLYLTCALMLAAMAGTAHLLLEARIFDWTAYAGMVVFAIGCAAASIAAITASALRRFRELEI